jgi:tetrahydromethanopterin S-methyltransferase subunit B
VTMIEHHPLESAARNQRAWAMERSRETTPRHDCYPIDRHHRLTVWSLLRAIAAGLVVGLAAVGLLALVMP